jgi:hypothetical protein
MSQQTAHRPRPAEDDDAPAPSLLGKVDLNDRQVRWLRIAVIVMGMLIVMGLAAVIGRIIYLVARPSGQIGALSPGSAAPMAPEVRAAIPAGAHVRSVSLQGDRLAIHYETPAGSGIAIIDLASGRTLGNVVLVPQAPNN